MYNGKLKLTNRFGTNFSLRNDFDDVIALEEDVMECDSLSDIVRVANSHHKYLRNARVSKDNSVWTRLVFTDVLGNEHYLIAYKVV